MQVQHEGDGFYLIAEGKRLGEMTYTRDADVITILHTRVDDSLRGQGAGKQLVEAAVHWARAEKLSIVPVCSYAKATLERDASYADVLRR